jgi:hypothetical protein
MGSCRSDLGENALPVVRPPGGVHLVGEPVSVLLGEAALACCPLGFHKSDKADLLAEGKRFFREGEDDASIGVESVQGGSHGAEFRFQRMIFKIEFGLDAWDFSITAN